MNPLKLTPAELHQMVLAKTDATWLQLCRLYPKISRIPPVVKYNKRLKTTAGRAFYDSFPQFVDLSHSLLWEHTEEMLNQTLPHELAHLVAWTVFGDGGHGNGWKTVMRAIGLEPARCHKMINTLHEANKAAKIKP